jgi:hypothetical protein
MYQNKVAGVTISGGLEYFEKVPVFTATYRS